MTSRLATRRDVDVASPKDGVLEAVMRMQGSRRLRSAVWVGIGGILVGASLRFLGAIFQAFLFADPTGTLQLSFVDYLAIFIDEWRPLTLEMIRLGIIFGAAAFAVRFIGYRPTFGPGRCRRCGYPTVDLEGVFRCPECTMPIGYGPR